MLFVVRFVCCSIWEGVVDKAVVGDVMWLLLFGCGEKWEIPLITEICRRGVEYVFLFD
jgi:hypothetical protein